MSGSGRLSCKIHAFCSIPRAIPCCANQRTKNPNNTQNSNRTESLSQRLTDGKHGMATTLYGQLGCTGLTKIGSWREHRLTRGRDTGGIRGFPRATGHFPGMLGLDQPCVSWPPSGPRLLTATGKNRCCGREGSPSCVSSHSVVRYPTCRFSQKRPPFPRCLGLRAEGRNTQPRALPFDFASPKEYECNLSDTRPTGDRINGKRAGTFLPVG